MTYSILAYFVDIQQLVRIDEVYSNELTDKEVEKMFRNDFDSTRMKFFGIVCKF